MKVLYAVGWTEYERGWGQRPDGVSFHIDEKRAKAFVKRVVGDRSGPVPDEYTSPDGPPHLVEVSQALYDHVVANDGNYWSLLNDTRRAKDWTISNQRGR